VEVAILPGDGLFGDSNSLDLELLRVPENVELVLAVALDTSGCMNSIRSLAKSAYSSSIIVNTFLVSLQAKELHPVSGATILLSISTDVSGSSASYVLVYIESHSICLPLSNAFVARFLNHSCDRTLCLVEWRNIIGAKDAVQLSRTLGITTPRTVTFTRGHVCLVGDAVATPPQ